MLKYIFKESITKRILQYASDQYATEPEYLWDDYPEFAVLRRRDTKKWYALLMNISARRLGLDSDEMMEVADLRFDPNELPNKVDGKRYFLGYHMNKKHWITVVLNGAVPLDEILDYLDKSYALAKK